MKERGITMTAESVRAILDGSKTQTRRVVRFRSYADERYGVYPHECPYGVPGDRLWVKETWCPQLNAFGQTPDGRPPFFRADGDALPVAHKWRSSRYMPRWASRITLEITEIRVQRVQDISGNDARAEGFGRREHFIRTWDALNAKRGHEWDKNDWVWVISFKRVGGGPCSTSS